MLLKFYKENKPPKKTKKRTRRQLLTRINNSVFVPRVEPLQLMLRDTETEYTVSPQRFQRHRAAAYEGLDPAIETCVMQL